MSPAGTKILLGNSESARTVDTPAATTQDSAKTTSANRPSNTCPSLFDAQFSQGPIPCATPAPQPRSHAPTGVVTDANRWQFPSPKDNGTVKIDLQDIINLINEQLDRLNHGYEHSFFINDHLFWEKNRALHHLKTELNNNIYPTYAGIIKEIQEQANKKDVVKSVLFPSKTKSMFVAILKKINEKIEIHNKTRENYKNNTHKNANTLTALPSNCQKQILDDLSAEDLSAAFLTSQAFRSAKPLSKVKYWKEKFVSAGMSEAFFKQIPDRVKFEVLYAKIKHLTYQTNTELEFWMFAFLSGDEGLIQIAMTSNPDLQKTTSSSMNALHYAALGGNESLVRYLVETVSIRLDSKEKNGKDVLSFAVLGGNIQMVQYICEKLPTRFIYSDKDKEILQLAAENGHADLAKHIFKKSLQSVDSIDEEGKNILHYATKGGNLYLVKYILNKSNIPIDIKDNNGKNVLHYASEGGHVNLLKYFLKNSSIPIDSTDNEGNNALHFAAIGGHIGTIRYLREVHNLDPALQNKLKENAFFVAKKCSWGGGYLPGVHAALRKQKDKKDIHDDPQSFLTLTLDCKKHILGYLNVEDTWAALSTSKSLQDSKYILKLTYWKQKIISLGIRGDIVQKLPDYIDFNVLHKKIKTAISNANCKELEFWAIALVSGNERLVQTAMASDPDLQKKTSLGMNALHCAALGGNAKIFNDILKISNILIDSKIEAGFNILHCAACGGNLEIFQYAINSNIPIDSKDNNGMNALHYAAFGGHIHLVKYILQNSKISIHSTTNNDTNVLHCAVITGQVTTIHFLRKVYELDPFWENKFFSLQTILKGKSGENAFDMARRFLKGDERERTLEALRTPLEDIPDSTFL